MLYEGNTHIHVDELQKQLGTKFVCAHGLSNLEHSSYKDVDVFEADSCYDTYVVVCKFYNLDLDCVTSVSMNVSITHNVIIIYMYSKQTAHKTKNDISTSGVASLVLAADSSVHHMTSTWVSPSLPS